MANAQSSPDVKQEREITFFGDDKDHKFAETGESYNDVLSRVSSFLDEVYVKFP
jgi:broad specificity phosphatase PhoE